MPIELIDFILLVSILVVTIIFIIARISNKINTAIESILYSQINNIFIIIEIINYLINNNESYILVIQRSIIFITVSTLFLFISIALRLTTKRKESVNKDSQYKVYIKQILEKIEVLRHNTATKIQNISLKVDKIKQGQKEQEKKIKYNEKMIEETIKRLTMTLEVFYKNNKDLFNKNLEEYIDHEKIAEEKENTIEDNKTQYANKKEDQKDMSEKDIMQELAKKIKKSR